MLINLLLFFVINFWLANYLTSSILLLQSSLGDSGGTPLGASCSPYCQQTEADASDKGHVNEALEPDDAVPPEASAVEATESPVSIDSAAVGKLILKKEIPITDCLHRKLSLVCEN